MTEGNFVDYIKIYAHSGKGGAGSAPPLPKEVRMEVTEEEGVISLYVQILIYGHFLILNLKSTLELIMADMAVSNGVLERTGLMCLLMCLLVQL